MSMVFKQFSVSNDSDLSGVYGFLSSDANTCVRNSYVNNGTGIVNLTNNSKCYVLNCNTNINNIFEMNTLNNTTVTGNINFDIYLKDSAHTLLLSANNLLTNNYYCWDAEKNTATKVRTSAEIIFRSLPVYDNNSGNGTPIISSSNIVTGLQKKVGDNYLDLNSEIGSYQLESLFGYGVNCTLSKNSSFSISDGLNNIYQETICELGSLYNFPNLDDTIPLISIINKNNTLLSNYFKKNQLYSDYNTNVTYNYGSIVYYSNMYFMCIMNDTKNIIPGSNSASYNNWGPYSVYDDKIYGLWQNNHNYLINDIIYYNYKLYKCTANNVSVNPIGEESSLNSTDYWTVYNPDKQLLNYKYTDFSDLIVVDDWNQQHNYEYNDVVKYGDNYYICVNNTGVTTDNIGITNQMYWNIDNRYSDMFQNIYRRYDNIFVNDGNVNKFTNKSFLTNDTIFEIHNLLDIEILQNFMPKNLNGFKLTIKFYGQDMYNYINNNIIIYAGSSENTNPYFISTNNRSGYDPTNSDMLKSPMSSVAYENDTYRYEYKQPLVKTNDMVSAGGYTSRPVISKINISGLYNGNVDVIFINIDKSINRNLLDNSEGAISYSESNSTITWEGNTEGVFYVDNIPCSFTFKNISGKLNIFGENESLEDEKTNIILNTLKSDGYIFKFVNCENVEIKNIQFMMSYPNVFGIDAVDVVTPNDCYESFIIFDNSKAYISQCNYIFLYYEYSDQITFINNTYQVEWTVDGNNRSRYIFNHSFAGKKLGLNNDLNNLYNKTYIIEGLISCENNSQCLIENDEKPIEFTNINKSGNNKNYISLLSNSQATWLAIGLFDTPIIRETMIQYLVKHITGDAIKRYKNTSLSINSANFMNGVSENTTDYSESLSKTILKASVWKRLLNKYQSIANVDDSSSPLTPQMLYVFLKLWCDNDTVEVSPMNINNNYYLNNGTIYNVDTTENISSLISDAIYNKDINYEYGYDISRGKFKAAKILIDLLKTVEQNLNFDTKTDSDKSVSSYDTTTATGTSTEYKKTSVTVDTTLLDSLHNLINLITFEDPETTDNKLVKYLLNTCDYEENQNLKPISLINGSFETFKTILTQICINLGITSPTFDKSNITDVEKSTDSDDIITCSDMIINFVGSKKELDIVGNTIVSNFNNSVFYPSDETYFYDQVYIPENNSDLDTPITDFSYEQSWTMGVTLLGDSRGSSTVQTGGIWSDNTCIEMTYEPLEETINPITNDTQCVIKIHFIAPKVLFNWMTFFESIDELNWTCKTFMGVVESLLTLFGEGCGTDGFWIGFKDGYSYSYNISTGIKNPFYLIWYYLFNPTSETNTSQTTLQIAEHLYVINQLLSTSSSTVSGLLNHYHLLPQRLSQNSGIPIGSVCISWRSYLANLTSTSYIFPTTFNSRIMDLSTQLSSEWMWCDGRSVTNGYTNLNERLFNRFGNNTPNLGLIDHTQHRPYVSGVISGSAGVCWGEGHGFSVVRATGSATTNGPILTFNHISTRPSYSEQYNYVLSFGWVSSYTGLNNRYGTFTNSFAPLCSQLNYKVGYCMNGTVLTTDSGTSVTGKNSYSNSSSCTITINNFGLYDISNNLVSTFPFRYVTPFTGYGDSDTRFGGEYDPIPATRKVTGGCTCYMCDIITEILYVMKISGSITSQTNIVRMLRSVGYKSTLATQNNTTTQNNLTTPNVYYDSNGVVYNISFVDYTNDNNYITSNISTEQFKSNIWVYNNLLLEQFINEDVTTSTIYKYINDNLYISSELLKKYIQMKIVDCDQRFSALYNSYEDHHYGYTFNVNDKQYNNIPVDIIINSSGVGSNDLTLIELPDQVYQQIELLNRNSIMFGDGLFTSTNLSNINYSELLKCDIDNLTYYQYIELDHLTANSKNKIIDLFGIDYYNTVSDTIINTTTSVELSYTSNRTVTFDIYNDNNVKSTIFNRTVSNMRFIVISTNLIINNNELQIFVDSLQTQRSNKYNNRNIKLPEEQYNYLTNKYGLTSNEDSSLSVETLVNVLKELDEVYDAI